VIEILNFTEILSSVIQLQPAVNVWRHRCSARARYIVKSAFDWCYLTWDQLFNSRYTRTGNWMGAMSRTAFQIRACCIFSTLVSGVSGGGPRSTVYKPYFTLQYFTYGGVCW